MPSTGATLTVAGDPDTRRTLVRQVFTRLVAGTAVALLGTQIIWIGQKGGLWPAIAIAAVHLFCLALLWTGIKKALDGAARQHEGYAAQLQTDCRELRDELSKVNIHLTTELTDRKRAEEVLSRTVLLEKAVLAVSSHLVGAADIDQPIREALSGIGKVSGSSRVALYLIREQDRVIENTHEWTAEGNGEAHPRKDQIPAEGFPWISSRVRAGECVYLSDSSSLPEEARAELDFLLALGTKSILLLPFRFGEDVAGFLSLSSRERTGSWPEEDLSVLRIFAEIIGAALSRKQLQDQLLQSQKMEAVGRLAGGMAHDFNNILTVIMAYSEFMLNGIGGNQSPRHDITEIRKAAERASSLIRQLLAFSRRQIMQPQVLDLNALVSTTEQMLRRLIGEDIEIVTRLQEQLGRIKVDPIQMEQVIFNLAVNARDAMSRGGRLTIRTANIDEGAERPGPHVLLSVSDTGCGMSEEVQTHMFEPFFTTKKKGEGTGLGLSTVYGIVKQSEGHIVVASRPGSGSSFDLYFPRITAASRQGAGTQEAEHSARGGETVLVVEDEEMVRELIDHSLSRYSYRVIPAACPDDAIRICREHPDPINLMVTDLVMPQMDGTELAKAVADLRPDMKVLYMSGYIHNTKGIPEIASSIFIQKPFTPDTLAKRVRGILDGNG